MQMLFQWDMSQQDFAKLEGKFWKSAKAADKTREFANELFEYIVYYNNFRPHQAIGGKTPKEFAAVRTQTVRSAN